MSVSRSLTAGEISLAQEIFGNSVDYTTVKIHDRPFAPFHQRNVAMTPNGQMYMNGCYSEDYSKTDPQWRSLFIHEMTHVWQYQNKVLNLIASALEINLKHKFNYNAAYAFQLDAGKDLLDYGMEQQAAIVEEYFLVKHEGLSSYAKHCQNACDAPEKIALYEKVLEKFRKNTSYAKNDTMPPIFKTHPPRP
jgi:hypothetical protein